MAEQLRHQRQKVLDNMRWLGAGLSAVCVAGLLGLLQAREMTTCLDVACFGFATGLAGAVAILMLWEAFDSGPGDDGSSGALELLVAVLGTAVGVGGVAAHLNGYAAFAGAVVFVSLLAVDAVITLRERRARSRDAL